MERIDSQEKNWKFSSSDLSERAIWDEYSAAYEDAINETASRNAPWYVFPADQKWYTRYLVSEAILDVLKKISPQYPELPETEAAQLGVYKEALMKEEQ